MEGVIPMLRVKEKGGACARATTSAAIANMGSPGTEGFFHLEKKLFKNQEEEFIKDLHKV
jgi:hypothetical protein